jgi:hypothetical protein
MVKNFHTVHNHEERLRKARMVYYMVYYSRFDKALCLYSEIQERMVFGNYSRSNYYIPAK